MMDKCIYLVGLVCLFTTSCTMRQAGYTAVGAAAGGGIGYAIHRDSKEAAIGGLAGALGGNLVGQWQDKSEKIKHNKIYQEGYVQAKVDAAVKNWDDNTGKPVVPKKRLVSFMVPKREENNVIYDAQEVKVEDYK